MTAKKKGQWLYQLHIQRHHYRTQVSWAFLSGTALRTTTYACPKICICFWPHYPNWADLMKGVNGKSNSRNPCLCWKLGQLDLKKGARPSSRNCPCRWWSPENAGGHTWTTWACTKHLFHIRALQIREMWMWGRNHLVGKHLLHEEGISSFSYMAMPWADFMWAWIPHHERLLMGSLELIKNMLM